jgi:quercetin dioxygenase-like cupin family protein
MTKLRIQVIVPETVIVTDGVEDAVIDNVSNGATDTRGLSISVVRFPQGIRRPWSSHPQDQYAWIISGTGVIASEDWEAKLTPGTLVFIPANMMHQHGASDEAAMTQISIIGGDKPRDTRLSFS